MGYSLMDYKLDTLIHSDLFDSIKNILRAEQCNAKGNGTVELVSPSYIIGTSNDLLFPEAAPGYVAPPPPEAKKPESRKNFLKYDENGVERAKPYSRPTATVSGRPRSRSRKSPKHQHIEDDDENDSTMKVENHFTALKKRVIEVGFHARAKYANMAEVFEAEWDKDDAIRGLGTVIMRECMHVRKKFKCGSNILIDQTFASLAEYIHLFKDVLDMEELMIFVDTLHEFHTTQGVRDLAKLHRESLNQQRTTTMGHLKRTRAEE